MWSVLAHPEKMLKAARGCLWWTLIVTLQTLTSCLETLHHFISSTGLTREETKLSAEAGRFTRQVLIHNKPNLQVNMLHWQLLTFSHQHSARISGNLQRWNWFLGACEEKCEPIPHQERRERGREAEWRERGESGKVMAGFPAVFEGNQRPKQRGTGINRYILCDVGKGWKCVCMSCMCVFVCIFMCVCVCVSCGCSVRPVLYLTVTPSFSSTRTPFSWYSSRVSQKLSLSFMMSASTAPPRNTMCFRLGGSSIRILNFYRKRNTEENDELPILLKVPKSLHVFLINVKEIYIKIRVV